MLGFVGSASARATRPFVITTERIAQSAEFGTLMVCPSHEHGAVEEAEQKLRRLLEAHRTQPAAIWICRVEADGALKRFSPLIDRVIVNPLVQSSDLAPDSSTMYFPGANHPVLNEFRRLRALSGDAQLLACIDLQGEKRIFGERRQSFEETTWQVLAALGCGYRGFVWRDNVGGLLTTRIRQLQEDLLERSGDLAASTPVRWVKTGGSAFGSAFASEDVLFVSALHPEYMSLNARGEFPFVRLPVVPGPRTLTLDIEVPGGREIDRVISLFHAAIRVDRKGHITRLECPVLGAGDLIICTLRKSVGTNPADGDEAANGSNR